jgi:peptide/nickel transport system substrate-binding protein
MSVIGKFKRPIYATMTVLVSASVLLGMTSLASAAKANTPKRGGSMGVTTEIGSWGSFDPISNPTPDVDLSRMIFGELVSYGNGTNLVWNLATGYKFIDKNKEAEIFIRPGVKFSDGTPFTATAVAWNWTRDLNPANAWIGAAVFSDITGVKAVGKDTVLVSLSQPFADLIPAIIDGALDFIISPSAYASEGPTNSGQHPVGAGPFTLESNETNVTAVVVRNPHYWNSPEPYLNQITFSSLSNDQSSISALQSGESNLAEWVSTPQILNEVPNEGLSRIPMSAQGMFYMNFNNYSGVMSNLLAREAVWYASDFNDIDTALYQNLYPRIETPSTQYDLYYEKSLPGFRAYDPTKAAALVKQLGGLNFTVITGRGATGVNLSEALIKGWDAIPGMNATLQIATGGATQFFGWIDNHQFDVEVAFGTTEYDAPINLTRFYTCTGQESSVCDPTLEKLVIAAESDINPAERAAAVKKMYEYVNNNLYMEPIWQYTAFDIATPNVHNVSIKGSPDVPWEEVWLS